MKPKPAILLDVFLIVVGFYAAMQIQQAEMLEWELRNRVPTSTVADSKRYHVFATELEASPMSVDLGDTTYKIESVWVEHRTEPQRVSIFSVHQQILPEMTLCVRIEPVARNHLLAQTEVRIKSPKNQEVFDHGFRNCLVIDAGREIPTSVVLRCDTREKEAVIQLKKKTLPAISP